MTTTISVNGIDGVTLARSTGIRRVQDDSQALVLHNQQPATRNGRPGSNAPQAVTGGPAGTLGIQLFESQLSQGAIHVRVVESTQAHRLSRDTEVAMGRNVRLTAIGGIGESGQDGGSGERGRNGADGVDAARGSDATNGTDGGDGGAAGRGSNGADGGPGGELHIIMDEQATHLLMAVSWDVRGGVGGRAGKHGSPGDGGTRGIGGQGWKWEEIVGYRYFCTDSCIKRDANTQSSGSTAMVRLGSQLNARANAFTAPMGALLVSGNNLQRAIVQARSAYRAVERPRADPGACKCGGGTGTCTGCDMKPIVKQFKRAPGLDGRDGEKGANITTPLARGVQGQEGTVTITVRHNGGLTRSYTSAWSLELVDFELEDGNSDGIFEPGEFLHIRRVKVRNTGGMPSPACRIPVSLADHSDHFEEVLPVHGGIAYLPTNIPAAGEASMEGSIKVRIKPSTRPVALGTRYLERGWLQIRADMPWLERRLPSFEVKKEVDIAYPCGFEDFEHLSTVAQGAISKIQYQIRNFGTQPIGEQGAVTGRTYRMAEVAITIPQQHGRMLSASGLENTVVDQSVPYIRPKDVGTMQQQFRVLAAAKNHDRFRVTFDLYIESPEQSPGDEAEMVLVERRAASLQVSSAYTPKPNARFLLVTNPHTTERQSQAVQDFVQNSLLMEVDICNVHQNGGLLRQSDVDFDDPPPILTTYLEKTIMILNDEFEFFDAGPKTATQLCDPDWLNKVAVNNSSSLFIGTLDLEDFKASIKRSVFPLAMKARDAETHVKPSHVFSSQEELVGSILQEKGLKQEIKSGTVTESLSIVNVKKSKWHLRRNQDEHAAKNLALYLRDRLPNERFVVSHDSSGHILIFKGLGQNHFMRSTESQITLRPASEANPTLSRLDRFSKYMIIAAIPMKVRVELLWGNAYTNQSIVEAIELSVSWELTEEMTGLQVSKYKGLMRTEKGNVAAAKKLIQTHLPLLAQLINNSRASHQVAPPEPLVRVLVWVFVYASCVKRHRSLKELIALVLRSRASTSTLVDSEDFKSSVASCDLKDLIDHISNLTQTAPYILEKGQASARDAVAGTEYWPPSKWDGMVAEIESERAKLEAAMTSASKERGRMLMDPLPTPVDSAAELSV